jgi:lysozyme family protein
VFASCRPDTDRDPVARSYLRWGEEIDQPRLAAIAVFPRSADPSLGHVGFVVGITDDDLIILGGNQSDAVSVDVFPRAKALSYRWPSHAVDTTLAQDIFDTALAHVFEMEGGYTDDPHDPGGPTNLGITLATYAMWRRIAVTPDTFAALKAELKSLDHATAAAIYRARYWRACHAEELPAPVALMHFDAAVNHGVGGSIRIFQQALNVTIDGEVGPETLGAATSQPPAEIVARYAEIRTARYRALPHFWRFGRGWLNRVTKTRAAALRLVTPTATRKDPSMTTLPTEIPPKWWGASMTIWGTILTAVSTVLPAIGPLFGIDITAEMITGFGHSITALFQALGGVIGTALAIYGRVRAVQPLVRRPVALRL